MMKRKIIFLTSVIAVSTVLGGCTLIDKVFGEKVELNERQCEILWSMDLPADWDELGYKQRESIVAIEEMLEYLEAKYNKTFIYAGYRYPDALFNDEEALLAYAEGDDPDTQCFTVTRTEDGFEDSYDWVLLAPKYQKEMDEKLAPILEGQTYKMFTKLTGVKNGVVSSASILIYIESIDTNVLDGLFDKIVEKIGDEKETSGITMYCFDKEGMTSKMNSKNYEDCYDYYDIKITYISTREDRKNSNSKWSREATE